MPITNLEDVLPTLPLVSSVADWIHLWRHIVPASRVDIATQAPRGPLKKMGISLGEGVAIQAFATATNA
jgi:hypothetical protein